MKRAWPMATQLKKNKIKKPLAEHELRSAQSRAVKKDNKINPMQNMNHAQPMAVPLKIK